MLSAGKVVQSVCLLLALAWSSLALPSSSPRATGRVKDLEYKEKWDYVNVRPNAHMFWWLYYVEHTPKAETPTKQRPLVMWLQGGPGASSTGFGNFMELGPKTPDNNDNNGTWLTIADLIFVDNPVGTGFSYVEDDSAYTNNVHEIALDLVTLFKSFLEANPAYKTAPFYIFCESYGGKMDAAFAQALYKASKAGQIDVNFKGVGLGDSWISPIDFVLSYGSYLYYFSRLDSTDLDAVLNEAKKCKALTDAGQWGDATNCWGENEGLVGGAADGVSWYNVMKQSGQDPWSINKKYFNGSAKVNRRENQTKKPAYNGPNKNLYDLMVGGTDVDLDTYMNTVIRKKLKIIPPSVTWGGQSGEVFQHQSEDFMKPVVDVVDDLIANTTLSVNIYNGQLDLICDTYGVEQWMTRLEWEEMGQFRAAEKHPFNSETTGDVGGFKKFHKNLAFYWVLAAGHMCSAIFYQLPPEKSGSPKPKPKFVA